MRSRIAIAAVCLVACGGDVPASEREARVTDVTLSSIQPGTLVPGSTLVIEGAAFVPAFAGTSVLALDGDLDGSAVSLRLPARFIDYDRLEVDWPGGRAAGLDADAGLLRVDASVQARSTLDARTHLSAPLAITLEVASALTPRLDALQNDVVYVNDPIVAHGDGFLLGGGEGQTLARIEGCFTREGSAVCAAVGPVDVPAAPLSPYDRTRVAFPFSPYIAGILPGRFEGSVRLVNRHGDAAGAVEIASETLQTDNSIREPAIVSFSPEVASLGQYVDIRGGGFIGPEGAADATYAVTIIALDGSFTPEGGAPIPASVTLVPEFRHGQLVRYVLNEEDELGQAIDLRAIAGSFVGTAQPITSFGSDSVSGPATGVHLGVAHVKQVVHLRFLPHYVESLRHFGLRAAEALVRQRVVDVVHRDFGGVNLEVRVEAPDDFALYSEVEIGGPDPNGIGLLGYDNTPGKDDGNLRLYDKIGGVNALTQLDGYPGYGGIFVESLFVFSQHPGPLAEPADSGHARFDEVFDPFRPDVGGDPIAVGELATIPYPIDTGACPAPDRPTQIACAITVLGNLIGTTVSHEIAHSLGLADPGGEAFHNDGDFVDALMDAGSARPFVERAELDGAGPGVFCAHNYAYLRAVLPTSLPDPLPSRPQCP